MHHPYYACIWYICLHLVNLSGKCRKIYHTWILLVRCPINFSSTASFLPRRQFVLWRHWKAAIVRIRRQLLRRRHRKSGVGLRTGQGPSTWRCHLGLPRLFCSPTARSHAQSHRIHVWYIYLHLVDFYGKCRYHKYTIHGSYGNEPIPYSNKNDS